MFPKESEEWKMRHVCKDKQSNSWQRAQSPCYPDLDLLCSAKLPFLSKLTALAQSPHIPHPLTAAL